MDEDFGYTALGFMAVVVAPIVALALLVNSVLTPSKQSAAAPAAVVSTQVVEESKPVATPVAAPVVAAPVEASVSRWRYHTNTDKMDGHKWTNAVLDSTSTEEFTWPYKRKASLSLIYQGDSLLIRGTGTPGFDCISHCYVDFKFDDGQIISSRLIGAGNGDIDLISTNSKEILTKIASSKKILIKPRFLGDNQSRVFEFDASGFDSSKMIKS